MAKLNRIAAALMAAGMVGAPFAALADASDDAVAVSLAANMTTGGVTVTASDTNVVTEGTDHVDFFASAAATGAVAYAGSSANSTDVGAVSGAIAPGSVSDLTAATTVAYDGEGTVTVTFDTSGS